MTKAITKAGLKSVADLIDARLVPAANRVHLDAVAERYAIAIPPHLAKHVALHDSTGPLARQFVPDARELRTRPDDNADPIGDDVHSPIKGIVHRYRNRVLLKIVHVCPVYCRFCFRREMIGPGENAKLTNAEIAAALAYIAADPGIEEVIMTGGDPLVLSPRRIAHLTRALSDLPHVKKLRWHSRIPVATPERVTGAVVSALTATDKHVRVAVHTNHASELTREAHRACHQLHQAGIELLSQSVLLRGVNDNVAALSDLFEAFGTAHLRPYYLHQLDQAPGTHHFRVSIREGQALLKGVRQCTPLVTHPQYILDIPGGFGKIPLAPSHIRLLNSERAHDIYRLCDPNGRVHIYHDVRSGVTSAT